MSRTTRSLALLVALVVAAGLAATAVATAATGRPDQGTVLTAVLKGTNEVPPADPDGVGRARLTIDTVNDTVCFVIGARKITLPALSAHIHEGDAGVNGPIVITLAGPDSSGLSRGCVQADHALLLMILADPSHYYVNVHNTDFPSGAIRGQLSG